MFIELDTHPDQAPFEGAGAKVVFGSINISLLTE